MATVPLTPNLKSYRGSKENLRRKHAEFNEMARRVADHVNTLMANNPPEIQQHMFGMIAIDLGLTAISCARRFQTAGTTGSRSGFAEKVARRWPPTKKAWRGTTMSGNQTSLNSTERQIRNALTKKIGTKGTLISLKQRGKDGVFVHIVAPADFASVGRILDTSCGDIARDAGVDLHVTLASSWKPSST